MPENAVLIKKGNYLYLDGEKVFADIEVLREADERITQLNKIIDGANNAYNSDAISKSRRNEIRNDAKDSIEEYEEVIKGEKSLSKVSEVKKSYKAKVGNKNNTVEKNQQKLYDLGYTSQLVTGYYGEITFNNIVYFQIVNNLNVTGWMDSDTYEEIMDSTTDVSSDIDEIGEQLDTLPLSKTDKEKGVKVVTIGFNQYYDCTEVLNEVFLECADEVREHEILYPDLFCLSNAGVTLPAKAAIDIKNLAWFISKVNHKEEWDIKRSESWRVTVGTTYPGIDAFVMLYGKLYTVSQLGNLLYGYTGTAMKIPEEILYMSGGFAATKSLKFIILEGQFFSKLWS